MSRRPAQLVLMALVALVLGACGQNPYGVDAYGNPIDPYADPYGTGASSSYGTGYDTGSSYGSGYGGSTGYDTGYSSGSGTGYGTSTGGTGYGSSTGYGTGTTGTASGTYGDYGTAYGDDAIAANPNALASPGAAGAPVAQRPASLPPVLSAWVTEVKEPGFLSRLTGGKITCKVEIENPTNRVLNGKLRVRFLDNGNPTGVIQTRRVTLQPKEKQVLTFSAEALRLDDAEATIETEAPTTSGGAVVDRVTDRS